MIEVNVGIGWIERNDKGKKVNRNMHIKSTFEGDWEVEDDHWSFRRKIHEAYPGKRIIGYCPSEKVTPTP